MSIFGRIFKRKDSRDIDEDMSIYKEEPEVRSSNRLTSFLFGFFALLVTLLIAAGLFFGGRAVYRALNGSDETVAPSPQNTSSQQAAKESSQSSSKDSNKSSEHKTGSTPSTGDNLPSTGDNLTLPKTGDPGM